MQETDKPKSLLDFENEVAAVTFTAEDAARAATLAASGRQPGFEPITPAVAAAIYTRHNDRGNRSLNVARCRGYSADMQRGEWKTNHMAIAFYANGQLADGQHRIGAIAISGKAQTLLVTNDIRDDAIDTIDRATRRNAGEALEMQGIVDGKLKAAIAKAAMAYSHEVETRQRLDRITDPQLEAFVNRHDMNLSTAIDIGRRSVANINEPVIGIKAAAQHAFLAMLGGFPESRIREFLACVQQGVASYSESPTLELSRRLQRAKLSEKRKDRLGARDMMALMVHAMTLWIQEKRVARLTVNSRELPDHRLTAESVQPVND